MENELLEIMVFTRKDLAGLIIPTTIFINAGIEDPVLYDVIRVIRRDNEKINGVNTIIFTCIVDVDGKKDAWDIRFYPEEDRWVLWNSGSHTFL